MPGNFKTFLFASMLVLLALLASITSPARAATAPSFDCAKATIEAERLICASDDLSQLDATMARTYHALRKRLGPAGRKMLATMQKIWLRERNKMIVADTIEDAITNHIEFLKNTPSGMVPFHAKKAPRPGRLGGST